MPTNKEVDLATLKQGKPYIRSVLAFILRLRFGNWDVSNCYTTADVFITQLERDIKES